MRSTGESWIRVQMVSGPQAQMQVQAHSEQQWSHLLCVDRLADGSLGVVISAQVSHRCQKGTGKQM